MLFQPKEKLLGVWHSEFETPFGMQTYHFNFSTEESGAAVARAEVESGNDKRTVQFTDVKIDGNTIAFVESRQLGEREMRISYKGELKGPNLALTRSLGQRGDQESIATRELPKPQVENPAPVVDVKIDRVIKDAFKDKFLIGMAGDLPSRYSSKN